MSESITYRSGYPGGLTVLMSVYARDTPLLFGRAVESVYANSVQPDDFVLVVDGPVPAELDAVIDQIKERYPLRTHRLPQNIGLRNALNSALPLIHTTWLARADADDINLPQRFEAQLAMIRGCNDAIDLLGSAIQEVDIEGHSISLRHPPLGTENIIRFAARRNPFNHMTVVYKVELARSCGGYPDLYLKEDYGLWALMLSKGARVMNSPEILVHATTGESFYQRRGGWKSAIAEWRLQNLLVSLGLKPRVLGLADFILRAGVLLAPPFVRRWVYLRHLRN